MIITGQGVFLCSLTFHLAELLLGCAFKLLCGNQIFDARGSINGDAFRGILGKGRSGNQRPSQEGEQNQIR